MKVLKVIGIVIFAPIVFLVALIKALLGGIK